MSHFVLLFCYAKVHFHKDSQQTLNINVKAISFDNFMFLPEKSYFFHLFGMVVSSKYHNIQEPQPSLPCIRSLSETQLWW